MKKREWVGSVYGEVCRVIVAEDGAIGVQHVVNGEIVSVGTGEMFARGVVSQALWDLMGVRAEATNQVTKTETTSSGWVKCADCSRVAMSRSLISHQSTCSRRGNGGS